MVERREFLKQLFATRSSGTVRFSATFDVPASEIIVSACRMGLEGVIGKRKDSIYVSRRSPNWIKLKCSQRQEFVIGGYTDPQGTRIGIGSLLLGYYDEEQKLRYAGNVGTGFSDRRCAISRRGWIRLQPLPIRFSRQRGSVARCIGSGRNWWAKSPLANGRGRVISVIPYSKA